MRHLSHKSEGARLRSLASKHGLDLFLTQDTILWAESSDLTRTDLLVILRNGCIVKSFRCGQQWRRIVRGNDRDGEGYCLTVTAAYAQKRIVVLQGQKEASNDW
jgi:hypothetical protein